MVHLVDRDHVRDLHDPRLQRLHGVARARHEHEEHRVGDADHLDLALARTDGLEEHELLAGGIEQEQRLERRLGKPAEVAARSHRADEDAGVEEVIAQADAVAEEGPVRERARRVDRHDTDLDVSLAHEPQKRRDQARLADAGRAREADRVHAARLRVELRDEVVGDRVAVLDERDRASERAAIPAADAGGEGLTGPVAPAGHRADFSWPAPRAVPRVRQARGRA